MLPYPRLLALLAGALSATGFAPLELWPVALACFALLIRLLLDAPSARAALVRAWLFGWAHFTVGLNWIAHAFTYQDAMPHWFGYGAVALLSVYLAVYPALAGLAAWRARAVPVAAVLAFAAGWIVSEWLRATMFTGFAWNPLAAIWVPIGPVTRIASWTGTLGLSGLTALAAGGLALLAGRHWRGAALVAPLALLSLFHVSPAVTSTGKAVRIVQPNVPQEQKIDPRQQMAIMRKLVRLSGEPGPKPRLLLWPEAAIDNGYLVEEDALLREWLTRRLGPGDMLLTGGMRLEYDETGALVGARNSVFALGPDARILGRYDKAHLVPYGEYLPMRPLLSAIGLSRLVPGDFDFWPGPGAANIAVPGFGTVGFQVCYEIVFSGDVVNEARRPDMLFNPSNDAWFGGWGPPQHLAQARLRAAEEGLPVLRSTPTGISALIGPDGEIVASLPLGRAGAIDGDLPAPYAPTPFARGGTLPPLLLALALGGFAVVMRRRAR